MRSAFELFAVSTCSSKYSHFLTMPKVGFDFSHNLFFRLPSQTSCSESCVYNHGKSLSAATPSSSFRITRRAFFNSSSRYPSATNPSVVILINFGLSFRDCDCSIDLPMMFSFISWVSSTMAKSIFRPSLFFVRSDILKIFVFVDLFRINL